MNNIIGFLDGLRKNRFYADFDLDLSATDGDIQFTAKVDLIEDQLLYPPFGLLGNDSGIGPSEVYKTSGTSGKPLLVGLSKYDLESVIEVGCQTLKYTGMGDIGSNEVVINCLNLSMWAGGFLDGKSIGATGAAIVNYGTGNTRQLIDMILNINASYKVSLHCTPSYLPLIESRLKERGITNPAELGIHALYLGAEGGVQNNQFRDLLIQSWNCNVYNANYGMSEVCSIFASANKYNVLKFSDKFLSKNYVELYINGKLKKIEDCSSGEIGEMVVTTLYKGFQPLFRYRTKEILEIKSNSGGVYFEIIGRSDDMIVYKGINFYPEQVRSILTRFPELTGYYQVESTVDKFGICNELKLLVVASHNYDSNSLEKLGLSISDACQQEIKIRFKVLFVDGIELKNNKHSILKINKEHHV